MRGGGTIFVLNMARPRLQKGENTVTLKIEVPASVKDWLLGEPGGWGRGGIGRVVRRLIKEEQWRRAGKYADVEEGK